MQRKFSLLLLTAFLFITLGLFLPQKILAVTVTINSYPAQITHDPFNIDVSVSGASAGTNYLRIDLYKESTTNYFGQTFNGSAWYNGSAGTSYFPIVVGGAMTSATIQGQIGSPTLTQYPGPGPYKLRVRRYTSSGNAATSDTQTPVDIEIIEATQSPTPTPTLSPTSIPTQSPTSTPVATVTPTDIPTPTLTPTATPTQTPEETTIPTETLSPSPTPTLIPTESPKQTPLATPSPTPKPNEHKEFEKHFREFRRHFSKFIEDSWNLCRGLFRNH